MNDATMMDEATPTQRDYLLRTLQQHAPNWTTVASFLGASRFDVQTIKTEAEDTRTTHEAVFLSRVFSAAPPVLQKEFCRALDYASLRAVSAEVSVWREFAHRPAAASSPMITDAPRGQAISASVWKAAPLSEFVLHFPAEPRESCATTRVFSLRRRAR